ncbi:MAG: hypothetical protein HQ532_02095 [Candidatus Omnitrophica bacterium]|nr:hypothetical protein [Candidatus Omnitrophota bacterium]
MKTLKKIFRNLLTSSPKNAFYLIVKCPECGEEVKVRINRSSDFQVEYNPHNPKLCYTIKKEVIGKNCFNLMAVTLALTKNAEILFSDTKACKFIKFQREE